MFRRDFMKCEGFTMQLNTVPTLTHFTFNATSLG